MKCDQCGSASLVLVSQDDNKTVYRCTKCGKLVVVRN